MYGTWSKDELLQLVTDKLTQCVRNQMILLERSTNNTGNKRLWMTIQSGLYSTKVLKILQGKGICIGRICIGSILFSKSILINPKHFLGMSIYSIIKAMKLGLINLTYCELVYFKDFKVESYILEFKRKWSSAFDDELISNLKTTGLNESECWNIVVYGIRFQSQRIHCHLMLSGIDVPGILNWQSPVNDATPEITQFLRHIGINEDIIQVVEQYGIDDETIRLLIDLGLHKMKRKSSTVEALL